MKLQIILLLSLGFSYADSSLIPTEVLSNTNNNSAKSWCQSKDYTTKYFTEPVDHFSYANQDTFALRYLISNKFWKKGNPIFFYTGNEGDVLMFCQNTGFVWEIAPEFGAMVIFAEHRYYGESMPYKNDSYKDIQHVGYLSSEQALADFAELIQYLKSSIEGFSESPVILFGGSYGGMLASWFRMKYPHLAQGAIAASAPILWFGNLTSCGSFSKIVTNDYKMAHPQCPKNIQKSWNVINVLKDSDSGRDYLSKRFKMCDKLNTTADVDNLKNWLASAWNYMAMTDYPYPTSFLQPMPGWPVQAACSYLNKPITTRDDLINAILKGVSVYFNSSGQVPCFQLNQDSSGGLGEQGWDFQACTEMVMPMCSDGINDMFEPSAWNYTNYAESCKKKWDVMPRPMEAITEYGGMNIKSASNILFSNGNLDPWSAGGVRENLSDSLIAIMIQEAAHHLDLRGSDPADPQSVKDARNQEKYYIRLWIKEYKTLKNSVMDVQVAKNPQNGGSSSILLVVFCISSVMFGLIGFFIFMKRKSHQSYMPLNISEGITGPPTVRNDTLTNTRNYGSSLKANKPLL